MGLIEAMIALALLMVAVFASSQMQVMALMGARDAGNHFDLDRLSGEMIETLRAHRANALADELDHRTGQAPGAGTVGAALVLDWQARTAAAIRGAGTSIDCDAGFCDIAIEWDEAIDGTVRRQRFRTGTPL